MIKNLRFNNTKPIYLQITEDIVSDIVSGRILPNTKLISIRELALFYKVNPNTIQSVVKELDTLGYIEIKKNIGIFIKNKINTNVKNEEIDIFIEKMKNYGFEKREILDRINEIWQQWKK